MNRRHFLLAASALSLAACASRKTNGAGRAFYTPDSGQRKLLRFNAAGKVDWEFPGVYCYDLELLPNGHLLFCDNAVKSSRTIELDPLSKKIVWSYQSSGEVFSSQRLPDGNTLIGENDTLRAVTVAPDGSVRSSVPLYAKKKGHCGLRLLRAAPDGTLWAAHYSDRCLRSYSPQGQVLQTFPVPFEIFGVHLGPDGEIWACGDQGAIIFSPRGDILWHLKKGELSLPLAFVCGFRPLDKGKILLVQWLGHGRDASTSPILEINRDKQVLWSFSDQGQTRWISDLEWIE